tara:strand:+ start:397 stop:1500 length:1104 start_codon:yes stop_codon:yes gene_type:complete
MDNTIFDVAIVGAGVIGLAIAKHLSQAGMQVVVLEKETRSGESTSSRNSGVIHAGMYYPENSLKARLCVEGNSLLYDYAKKKNIPHKKIGKYIVSTNKSEQKRLNHIYENGKKNFVDLEMVNKESLKDKLPYLKAFSAIYSPNTGIIDVPELIRSLEFDIWQNDGLISFNTECLKVKKNNNKYEIFCDSSEKFKIDSKILINASGLQSYETLKNFNFLPKRFRHPIYYAKGHYFKYSGKHPFTNLVYPINSESSLGIHVGFDMSGQLRFGPDLEWVRHLDYKFENNTKEKFIKSINSYWPDLDPKKLQEDYVGIRPKIQKKSENMKDFIISGPKDHNFRGFINLQGIESPGVTSSLAIAKFVGNLVL